MTDPTPLTLQRWRNSTTGEIVSGQYIYERWVASDMHANGWHDPARAEERVAEAMRREGVYWIDAEGRWEPHQGPWAALASTRHGAA